MQLVVQVGGAGWWCRLVVQLVMQLRFHPPGSTEPENSSAVEILLLRLWFASTLRANTGVTATPHERFGIQNTRPGGSWDAHSAW
jgi:hypothetical protein